MKIVDANTGQELQVGKPFRNVNGWQALIATDIGLMKGRALIKHLDPSPDAFFGPPLQPGAEIWTPLVIRYMHPSFFLQKVAFLPS